MNFEDVISQEKRICTSNIIDNELNEGGSWAFKPDAEGPWTVDIEMLLWSGSKTGEDEGGYGYGGGRVCIDAPFTGTSFVFLAPYPHYHQHSK